MDLQITEKYEILKKIGKGGYGIVYLGRHRQLGYLKAIKALSPKGKVEKRRVQREVDVLKKAQHPHVIKIDEVIKSKDTTYICMEYADGGSLEKKIRKNMPKEESLAITLDILKGVQALHARGIIHRDIKPENILFNHEGKIKIGDFGIAKTNTNISRLTKTGKMLGTIGYMSPEQLLGKKDEVDEQSDVYGVGIILYEMLVGQHPLKGADQIETVNRALGEQYIVSLEAKKVDKELREICYRAIRKNKAKRYRYANEMLEELNGYCSKNIDEKKIEMKALYSKGVRYMLAGGTAGALVIGVGLNMIFGEESLENTWERKNRGYQELLRSDYIKKGQILRLTQKEVQRNIYSELQKESGIDVTEDTIRGKELYRLGLIYYRGSGVEKNYEVASQYFEQATNYGVIDAYLRLGDIYSKGKGVIVNDQKALEYYESAAKNNDPRGYYNLGIMYAKQEKIQEFLVFLKKSAAMNHHESIVDLARFYEISNNEKELLYYLRKGSDIGNTVCLREMGANFLSGKHGFKKDEKKGIEYIKKSIIRGDIESVHFLLNYPRLSVSVKEKLFQDIFQFVEKKKERGDNYLVTLAYMYQKGLGVNRDYYKAKEFYEKAIKLGNTTAMNNLGNMYLDGLGVRTNYAKAKKMFEKAIEIDGVSGMNALGFMYSQGFGVKKNYVKAKELYERAVELGDASAMYNLGVMYSEGNGVKQDNVKAKELFEDAAELGNVDAMNNLAYMYMYMSGGGIEKNYLKARRLFEDAMLLGSGSASYNLGRMYFEGDGVQKNYVKAVELYEKAIDMGNSEAMGELGYLYLHGLGGVGRNREKAKSLFERAIKLEFAPAMVNLGQMYEQGGRQEDYNEAKKLYERAAELGNAIGTNNLAFMYQYGRGVPQDFSKAKELYENAIQLGSANAMNNLAFMYQNGYGVGKDFSKAKILYESAVGLGESNAMVSLGLMYYNGQGVSQDKQKAFSLFQKSALLGNQGAMNYLRTLK